MERPGKDKRITQNTETMKTLERTQERVRNFIDLAAVWSIALVFVHLFAVHQQPSHAKEYLLGGSLL